MKPSLKKLYEQGLELRSRIDGHLGSWPVDEKGQGIEFDVLSTELREAALGLIIDTSRWINNLKDQVLPFIVYDQQYLYYLLRQVEAAIRKHHYKRPYPETMPATISVNSGFSLPFSGFGDRRTDIEIYSDLANAKLDARSAMDTAISLILSVPDEVSSKSSHVPLSSQTFIPNLAFIIMAMDPSKPELDDICNTIMEVCQSFAIIAKRADDIEHAEKITEVVLQNIANAEFLIADLTEERPNVYYEIGFAHALGKRPILYRKTGTKLHFDLAVHNVPEYKNLTELRKSLQRRFEAILGKSPTNVM
jgi:hypothetical protein